MKNFNNSIETAQKIKNKEPLTNIDELKILIEKNGQSNSDVNKLDTKSWWRNRITTVTSSIILLSLGSVLLFTNRANHNSNYSHNVQKKVTQVVSERKKQEQTISTSRNDYSKNSQQNLENKKISQVLSSKTEITTEKPDSECYRVTIYKITKDKNDLNKNDEKPDFCFDISGVKLLYLTDTELNKLIPFFRINDSTCALMEEFILNDPKRFDIWRLDTLGYNKENLPILVKCYTTSEMKSNGRGGWPHFIRYEGWGNDDYSRTLFVSYNILDSNNNIQISDFRSSQILKNGEPFFHEFYNFNINMSMKLNELKKTGTEEDKIAHFKLYQEMKRKMYTKLIPVYVKLFKNVNALLWFVPN